MNSSVVAPLVSVLMCVYNTKTEYLSEAADSILGQTFQDFEFIIVDDGSDNQETVDYLEALKSKSEKIRLINGRENTGLTKALNEGISYCRGKYIARMDADDIASPDRLEKQYAFMESNGDVALCGGRTVSFEKKNEIAEDRSSDNLSLEEILKSDRTYEPEIYEVTSLIRHSGPAHPTFMLRKSFLEEHNIKYPEKILCAQDYGIMAEILKCDGIIRKLTDVLLYYRVHEDQITGRKHTKQLMFQRNVSVSYLSFRFPELSKDECRAIAMLRFPGYSGPSRDYINGLKKMFEHNKVQANQRFNQEILEREFRYLWVSKVITNCKKFRRPWLLLSPFTLGSLAKYREYKEKY